MIVYLLHWKACWEKERSHYIEIMFQSVMFFGILQTWSLKVERKLSVPTHNRKFLGLTTLVTFEPPVRLPMNTRRCSKTSLRVTDVQNGTYACARVYVSDNHVHLSSKRTSLPVSAASQEPRRDVASSRITNVSIIRFIKLTTINDRERERDLIQTF